MKIRMHICMLLHYFIYVSIVINFHLTCKSVRSLILILKFSGSVSLAWEICNSWLLLTSVKQAITSNSVRTFFTVNQLWSQSLHTLSYLYSFKYELVSWFWVFIFCVLWIECIRTLLSWVHESLFKALLFQCQCYCQCR